MYMRNSPPRAALNILGHILNHRTAVVAILHPLLTTRVVLCITVIGPATCGTDAQVPMMAIWVKLASTSRGWGQAATFSSSRSSP